MITTELSLFKKLSGGLWVGGTTYLIENAISFRPNLINRLVTKSDCSLNIPLSEVTEVEKRFGIITQIIDMKTSKGTLRIRCYSANAFLALIKEQIAKVRGQSVLMRD